MREDQSVSSHRACDFAAGAALHPGMGLITNWSLQATIGSGIDKVMAGGTPANPAALAFRPLIGLEVVVSAVASVVSSEVAIVPAHVVATASEVVTAIVA